MAVDVVMPRLSDSMEEGTVLKWLVEQGAEVKRGAPLVEIETDKANMTYDADTDGVLLEVLAKEGETLEVGQPIARIGQADEAGAGAKKPEEAPEPAAEPASAAEPEAEPEASEPPAEPKGGAEPEGAPESEEAPTPAPAPVASRGDGGRVMASPVARRVAKELGVELSAVEGTGPGGRVVKADVEAAAENGTGRAPTAADDDEGAAPSESKGAAASEADATPDPAQATPSAAPASAGGKGAVTVRELTRLQRTVSRRMAESKATVPDFALEVDVDMTLCIELRERLKGQTEHPPSYNDMVVKAAGLALREHPKVNGAYRDGKFELYERVNVGFAVAAQDALVVPVIQDTDQKSLGEISRQARRLIGRVRDGEITPPELSGGTFSVSNLGMLGVQRFTAIVNPPQAAILTVGALTKRPAVDERGRVRARDLMTLTLVCDHRILYGADGARFLAQVREQLEQPLSLAL
jgi:pyruvate dehydrogenase E2 component (dihydrolipoamide acetyltransferase)